MSSNGRTRLCTLTMPIGLVLAVVACAPAGGDGSDAAIDAFREQTGELVVTDGRVSRVSTLDLADPRVQFPFLHHVSFECPIADDVPSLFHWLDTLVIRNASSASAIDVTVGGRYVDDALTGLPEVAVYAGARMPSTLPELRSCLTLVTAASLEPGTARVAVEPGAAVVLIAFQADTGRFGTYRVTAAPAP